LENTIWFSRAIRTRCTAAAALSFDELAALAGAGGQIHDSLYVLLRTRQHSVLTKTGRTLVVGGQRHRRIVEGVEVLAQDRSADVGVVMRVIEIDWMTQQ